VTALNVQRRASGRAAPRCTDQVWSRGAPIDRRWQTLV